MVSMKKLGGNCMNEPSLSALESKKSELDYRRSLARSDEAQALIRSQSTDQNPQSYSETQVGVYHNIDKIILRWIEPDLFEFIPSSAEEFCFERYTGEIITPTSFSV